MRLRRRPLTLALALSLAPLAGRAEDYFAATQAGVGAAGAVRSGGGQKTDWGLAPALRIQIKGIELSKNGITAELDLRTGIPFKFMAGTDKKDELPIEGAGLRFLIGYFFKLKDGCGFQLSAGTDTEPTLLKRQVLELGRVEPAVACHSKSETGENVRFWRVSPYAAPSMVVGDGEARIRTTVAAIGQIYLSDRLVAEAEAGTQMGQGVTQVLGKGQLNVTVAPHALWGNAVRVGANVSGNVTVGAPASAATASPVGGWGVQWGLVAGGAF